MPVFAVIAIGYLLNKTGMFTQGFKDSANKFIFNVCLPLMVFGDMSQTDIVSGFDLSLVLFSAASTTIAFALIWLGARLFLKDKGITGAFVQAAYRSSVAVMGFAFMINIYGRVGLMPMIIIGCVPLYNIYAVTVLTFESEDRANDSGKGEKLRRAASGIIRNPIIIGIIAGCIGSLVNASGIVTRLTGESVVLELIVNTAQKAIDDLSKIATPLSLIVIGASFEGKKALAKIKPTAICCAVKLIVLPAVFLTAAVLMGFRGEALLALVIMLGSPTTPSCYIMALNMKNDGVLTSSVIAATTLLSSVTLTFWIFLMRAMGFIQ